MSKLGLGTVQFGCHYGISNKNGQVSKDEIAKILRYAQDIGIDTLDTAPLYGESEKVLGQFDLKPFKVVTKTIKIDDNITKKENLEKFDKTFHISKNNLGNIKLYGLMLHESTDLISAYGIELWNLVKDFKNKGYVDKIGVSVYKPEVLEEIINKFDIDIVQLPMNMLDQRFVSMLKKLKRKNIEIHTRSVFLQGLILMNEIDISPYFNDIKPILQSIPKPKLAHALQFVYNLNDIDKIIVGTTCLKELKEIVFALDKRIENFDYNKLKVEDERFILPQNWRLV